MPKKRKKQLAFLGMGLIGAGKYPICIQTPRPRLHWSGSPQVTKTQSLCLKRTSNLIKRSRPLMALAQCLQWVLEGGEDLKGSICAE